MGIPGAFAWRGTNEKEHYGHLLWKAPDGTTLPVYRFGFFGYCSYAVAVRGLMDYDAFFVLEEGVKKLVGYVHEEAKRTPNGPILLFDGCDHTEIEPQTSVLIAGANKELACDGLTNKRKSTGGDDS